MSIENITKRFVDLGLDEEEARVLSDLYMAGEAKAGDLAKTSGLARIKVYRILEKLQGMNIVEASMGRPVIFSAIPADNATERLIDHASSRLKVMESAREQVISELAMFKQQARPQGDAKYRIIQGRSQIYAWIGKMASSAKSEVLAYVEKDDLMRIYYSGLPEELQKAKKRGARVMILTNVDYTAAKTIKNYDKYAEIRHTVIPGMSVLLVVDESELVVSAMTKAAGAADQDVALWMNGKNFVAGIKGLLRDGWENAIDAQTRINIIKEGGRALQEVLIVKGQQPMAEFYASMIGRAKKEVLHVSIPFDSRFFGAFARSAKGASMRVLTNIDAGSIEKVKKLEGGCEIRHVGTSAGVNITLVDGEEVILTPDASGADRSQSAIWSSVSDYVEHYRTIFENLWSCSTGVKDRVQQVEAQARIAALLSSMSGFLKDAGFQIRRIAKGASGLAHEFSLVAEGRHGTVLVDIAGDDPQTAMLGFVVKCMDIKADCKMLVSISDAAGIEAPARALQGDIAVAGPSDALAILEKFVASRLSTGFAT